MLLKEFYDNSVYDPSLDMKTQAKLSDTRKKIVTLRDLNKLKKIRAYKKLKALQRSDMLSIIYGKTIETGI